MAPGLGLGLSASIVIAFHAVFLGPELAAASAARQFDLNERIARRLDVEADLKKKLEKFGCAPPAPNFARYRQAPPG